MKQLLIRSVLIVKSLGNPIAGTLAYASIWWVESIIPDRHVGSGIRSHGQNCDYRKSKIQAL